MAAPQSSQQAAQQAAQQLNVLVLLGPQLGQRERVLADLIVANLEARPGVEPLVVSLPRAEAMLRPRLVGLWTSLMFIGSPQSPTPADAGLLGSQLELLDSLPRLVFVGDRANVWPAWGAFAACQPEALVIPVDRLSAAVDAAEAALSSVNAASHR